MKETLETLGMLLTEAYVPVSFPETQALMGEDWFRDEAILDEQSKIGDSTYLVPLHRILG